MITNEKRAIAGSLSFILALGCFALLAISQTIPQVSLMPRQSTSSGGCTTFCLDNGDYCLFGTNFDNDIEIGLLYVNKRNVSKNSWDPSTSGEYARWVSRYGSVTINLIGYQMAWGGMNEAGLMISTMSLPENQTPTQDKRPPVPSPFWMQYQLDNHSTVEQVIDSDADLRIASPSFDHYLVCDRTGECATIEFMDGGLSVHTGESLPVKVLTNSTYQESIRAWQAHHLNPQENSLWRFSTAANRNLAFTPSSSDQSIAYAFETLETVSGDNTVWSFVYDPANLSLYFRTSHNPQIRYLDFASLDFSCHTPVKYLDIHADLSGDISGALIPYSHAINFSHTNNFFTQFEDASMSPLLVDALLWGVEGFSCQEGAAFPQGGLERYTPLLPPTVIFAGLMVIHRAGPIWIMLTLLSLAILVWRLAVSREATMVGRLGWMFVTILSGPFGLLAYVIAQRWKRRVAIEGKRVGSVSHDSRAATG